VLKLGHFGRLIKMPLNVVVVVVVVVEISWIDL
jgi:hypothetical protein